MYLTDQQVDSLREARSPHSQPPLLSFPPHGWSDCLGRQPSGHVPCFTSFLWLVCSCFSLVQRKQLPEVAEGGGGLGRSTLKAALASSSWLVNVASLEDYEDGSVSPLFFTPPFPRLAEVEVPRELEASGERACGGR